MKKTVMLGLVLFAVAAEIPQALSLERRIVRSIAHALMPEKPKIRVWIDQYAPAWHQPGLIEPVKNCESADLVILGRGDLPKKCQNKPLIVLRYDLLSRYPHALGAFFWQKGRPNIVLLASELEAAGIVPPPSFERYVEHDF